MPVIYTGQHLQNETKIITFLLGIVMTVFTLKTFDKLFLIKRTKMACSPLTSKTPHKIIYLTPSQHKNCLFRGTYLTAFKPTAGEAVRARKCVKTVKVHSGID